MKPVELGVWLHDQRVATLRSRRVGAVECVYTAEALGTWPGNVPLISCSLPLRSGKQPAWSFTTGLLPEGQHRQAMAGLAGVPTNDVLGMLKRFGRDVAGALVISADDPPLRNPSVSPYSANELVDAVAALSGEHPLGLFEDSELSIAGLADKMLLVEVSPGRFGRPLHGAPSTHILKVDDRIRRGLVRAEHACLELAAAATLDAANSFLLTAGDTECIIVRRFDRSEVDGQLTRVHQEDACQALGIDPGRNERRGKYEEYGGPGWRDVARVLERWAADPVEELLRLVDVMAFTVTIGNADAHGKNIALLHPAPGVVRLAPLYDTVPTMVWPELRPRAAMGVAGEFSLPAVDVEHMADEAASWGLDRKVVRERTLETVGRVRDAARAGAVSVDTPAVAAVARRAKALLGSRPGR